FGSLISVREARPAPVDNPAAARLSENTLIDNLAHDPALTLNSSMVDQWPELPSQFIGDD
ncbi:hypothetical protein, partial [Streptococcus pyogenes]|uniref:hypothetical protein n=1 Tax=Streptococcus pyogenes TaxID=1314 RepID=UPI001CA36359